MRKELKHLQDAEQAFEQANSTLSALLGQWSTQQKKLLTSIRQAKKARTNHARLAKRVQRLQDLLRRATKASEDSAETLAILEQQVGKEERVALSLAEAKEQADTQRKIALADRKAAAFPVGRAIYQRIFESRLKLTTIARMDGVNTTTVLKNLDGTFLLSLDKAERYLAHIDHQVQKFAPKPHTKAT